MTIRFKIAAAALGLVLATGVASAQTGSTTQTAPIATHAQTATSVKAPVKIAHKTHRVHVSHRALKHAKVAHRSLHSKLARKLGLKHIVKAPVAKTQIAKARLVGTQKHAANAIQAKTTVVR